MSSWLALPGLGVVELMHCSKTMLFLMDGSLATTPWLFAYPYNKPLTQENVQFMRILTECSPFELMEIAEDIPSQSITIRHPSVVLFSAYTHCSCTIDPLFSIRTSSKSLTPA